MNKTEKELLSNLNILYVEDEEDVREVLQDILELFLKKVYIASNGKEGLEIYKSHEIDIVMSDIQMPIMNGMEMVKEIKKINSDMQIALFTASSDPKSLEEAMNLGISEYIFKPLNMNQFFDSLVSMAKTLQIGLDRKNDEGGFDSKLGVR